MILSQVGAGAWTLTVQATGAPSQLGASFRDFVLSCSNHAANGFRLVNSNSTLVSNVIVANCNDGLALDNQGGGWSEKDTILSYRSFENAVGLLFTSSTGNGANSFQFTDADLWCQFTASGYTPDACLRVDSGMHLVNSRVRMNVNWTITPLPSGIHVAGSGSQVFASTVIFRDDGCGSSYQPNVVAADTGGAFTSNWFDQPDPYCHYYNGGGLPAGNIVLAKAGALQVVAPDALSPNAVAVNSLLPATNCAGCLMQVSDSTAITTEGQTCAGGSSHRALAFSNGSVWKCF